VIQSAHAGTWFVRRIASRRRAVVAVSRQVRRTRILLWIILLGNLVFAATDPWLNSPLLVPLEALKVVVIAAQVAGLLLLRAVRTRPQAYAIGVACGAVAGFASAVAGVITHDHVTTLALCIAGILTSAAVVPWGPVTQAVAAALAVPTVLVNTAVLVSLPASGYPVLGVVLCGIISVYVAAELERQRVAHRVATLALRRHEDELAHVLRLGTMGEMAAHLAHELTQPLGAICNYAAGCRRTLEGSPWVAPALIEALDEISHEAMRAGEIIRRLRGFVRKAEAQRTPLDVNAMVRSVARLIDTEARESGVAVRLALAAGVPTIQADAIQIEQVTINLVRNALESMQGSAADDHELVIATGADRDHVEVAISDTGPGLSAETTARAFEAFYTTKPGGLGMGLSISRSLIDAHGGRLWPTHDGGRGVTFRFRLPIEPLPNATLDLDAARRLLGQR